MAVDLRKVVQNAGRLIQEKVRKMMCQVLLFVYAETVRGVSWSEVATVPKRKSHRGLDLDLSLNSEVNIRKGWKENGGTK